MDITTDIRYSVLKEKPSSTDTACVADSTSSNNNNTNKRGGNINNYHYAHNGLVDTLEMAHPYRNTTTTTVPHAATSAATTDCVDVEIVIGNDKSTLRHDDGAASNGGGGDGVAGGMLHSNFAKYEMRRHLAKKVLILIIVVIVLFIILLAFSASKMTTPTNGANNNNNNNDKHSNSSGDNSSHAARCSQADTFCLSDQCMLVASAIHQSLNKQADPCEDFYEYACGGWLKRNLMPSGFPRWGTLSLTTYDNSLIIRDELESSSSRNSTELTEAEIKAKHFYKSCMDKQELIEKIGARPLLEILATFVHKNNSDNRLVVNASLAEILTLVQLDFGVNALFELNVLDDDKNSSYTNIEIIQGGIGLDKSIYINNSSEKNANTLEVYKRTIVNVLGMLFGIVEDIADQAEEMIRLESRIAQIMIPAQNLSNTESMYARVKLSALSGEYASFLDWTAFFNRMLTINESPERLTPDDEIIVLGIDYFQSLTHLIAEYEQDARKHVTLKLSVVWNLIKFCLPLLSKDYRNQVSILGEAMTGANPLERWQACVERTDNIFGLGFAVSRMFVKKMPADVKSMAQALIRSIKRSFVHNLPNLAWMDEKTRSLAEDKINSIEDLIGYPDFIQDPAALNQRYKQLVIHEDDYFGNEIRLVRYALQSEVSTYRTRVNRAEWEMTSSAVNAYYSPTRNQIVFPSGILREPFFHVDNPMSINYGSIGAVMGHEMTHGFDVTGREYDKNGMLNKWWNNETVDNYKHASQCIVDQYSKYQVGNESINGELTLGENIADNGGLGYAFDAYEKWIEENSEEKLLPLLRLSNRQLFFVSFAQTWCSKSTSDSLHMSLSIDQHSPPRYRVIGSVSNSLAFAQAFKCPLNSPMNPSNKCRLL